MSSTNSGIHISGNSTVNAGAMAAGDHAKATNRVIQGAGPEVLDELRRSLADLAEQVRARADQLEDPEHAAAIADLAKAEAEKEKPNHRSLLSLLQALGATVGSVAALGGSVTAIMATVSALAGG
jgi:hypothetical protein